MNTPKNIVANKMYANDAFSKWLGIDIIEVSLGECKLKMIIRSEMLNGFKIAHGGITYSLADSALAFASNSTGRQALSIETNISHTSKVVLGDTLYAQSKLQNKTRTFAIYEIAITNQKKELVALFKGTAYYTGREWE